MGEKQVYHLQQTGPTVYVCQRRLAVVILFSSVLFIVFPDLLPVCVRFESFDLLEVVDIGL